jgi:hypothetical protein
MNQEKHIVIGSTGGEIGDNICLTPIFKYFKNSTIEIHDTEIGRNKVAKIFEGIAKVVFKKEPISYWDAIKSYGDISKFNPNIYVVQNYFNIFGIENTSLIPYIILRDEEIEWAKGFLRQYENPIVFSPMTKNGRFLFKKEYSNISEQEWDRQLPYKEWYKVIEVAKDKFSLLQFNHEEDSLNHPNITNIKGLNIREIAACCKLIGKYLGVDTGIKNLALSVGCSGQIIVPSFGKYYDYNFPSWNLPSDYFPKEQIVKYYLFSELDKLIEDIIIL